MVVVVVVGIGAVAKVVVWRRRGRITGGVEERGVRGVRGEGTGRRPPGDPDAFAAVFGGVWRAKDWVKDWQRVSEGRVPPLPPVITTGALPDAGGATTEGLVIIDWFPLSDRAEKAREAIDGGVLAA